MTLSARQLSAATSRRERLVEICGANLNEGESFTTLELKINFLKPVWNSLLRATARVVKQGQTVGLVECDVTDDKDKLVAHATTTCMTLRGNQAQGR